MFLLQQKSIFMADLITKAIDFDYSGIVFAVTNTSNFTAGQTFGKTLSQINSFSAKIKEKWFYSLHVANVISYTTISQMRI